jgi:hypothetical protein
VALKGQPVPCVLDEPKSADIVLWLDASELDTLTYDPSTQLVSAWASRVGQAKVTSATESKRPKRSRGRVKFDGVDDVLVGSLPVNTLAYTVFAVVEVDGAKATHTLIHGVEPGTNKSGLLLDATGSGSSLRFVHTMPYGGAEADSVTASPFVTTSAAVVHATHTVLTHAAWNGASFTAIPRSAPSFDEALLLSVGAYVGNASRGLQGSVSELIVYDAAVSDGNAAKVRAYLTAKWLEPPPEKEF